jgi:PEP-CTERM motif
MLGTDMNTKLLAAAAFAAFGLTSTSAFAATCVSTGGDGVNTFTANCTQVFGAVTETVKVTTTTLSSIGGFSDSLAAPGFTMIDNFNGTGPNGTGAPVVANGFTVSGGAFDTGNNGVGANPPGDNSQYESVLPTSATSTPFTVTDTGGQLASVSFVMGSPDDGDNNLFNDLSLTVNGLGGTPFTLTGADVWGGAPAGGGNQGAGFLVTYTFVPNTVHSLQFSQTGGPAFEFDNFAGVSVPEPASWALMIMGFGAAGGMIRSQRRKAALA